MAILNTNEAEYVVDLTVAEVRNLFDILDNTEEGTDYLHLVSEMDKAQGAVHSGMAEEVFVVIRITP